MKKQLVSIVAPAYNEELVVQHFYDRITTICKNLEKYNYEILIVNDGSKDNTKVICEELCKKDKQVSFLSLSRNFGHEIALAAGLDYAKGDVVIIMDIDLQDTPEIIPAMLKEYENGFEVVNAKRISRAGETWLKKFTANLFYKTFSASSGKVKMPNNVGNYRLLSRKAVDAFKTLKETHRFARGLFCWIGFNTTEIEFEREPRVAGKTKYNYKTMINYAIEGLTSFTTAPLRWATYIGIFTALAASIYVVFVFYMVFTNNPNLEPGWSSMVVIMLFFGSVQLIILGVIGEYLGRIFNETKHRPLYFIEKYQTRVTKNDE